MRFWKPATYAALAGVALFAITAPDVQAHKGAKGIVKERMMSMKSMGDGMKAIAVMVTGKAPYDATKTRSVAAEIQNHASGILKQFPKGSIKGPSEALPAIWKDWDGFKGHADALARLAGQLADSADSGKAAALGLFARMGKTCSGCHDDYRKKKK